MAAMKPIRSLPLVFAGALPILGSSAFGQTTLTLTAPDAAAGEKLPGQAPNPGTIRLVRTGSR